MKPVIGVALLGAAVAGMVHEPDATAPTASVPTVRADRDEPRAFPLAGRWRYADTGGLLPRRSGCGVDEPALTLTPNGVTLTHGPWRQPVFTFADWRLKRDSDLELVVAAGGSALMERARLTLDLAHAGFIRLKAATAADGSPLAARAETMPAADRDAARAEAARLVGAFTLIRCPDPALDVAALLRGPVESLPPRRLVR